MRILVVGSMNMDIVTNVQRHPLPGETIHGRRTAFYSGGKGANQAVAAVRAGAAVFMAGALGHDFFGQEIRRLLSEDGIDLSYVRTKEETTGTALITIDESGENNIILSPGANGAYAPDDLADLAFASFDAVLLQNEIPWDVNARVLEICASLPTRVYYNPAPAHPIEKKYLSMIDVLILNELEAGALTGCRISGPEDAIEAASRLIENGVGKVVVTLGLQGSVYLDREGRNIHTPAYAVKAVDTTAAGDTFIGAFAAHSRPGLPVEQSLRYASAAAALTVSDIGAQNSIPTHRQITQFIQERSASA